MALDANTATEAAELGFDANALREKYRQERDKRMRADGIEQYREVEGEFARFVDDPYSELVARAPLSDEVEIVIIGGGFTGLLTAARMREAGIDDIRIIESAGDFGGTWYWNRYPGVRCDIESYIYMPLLEELGTIPTEKYACGAEILTHAQAIGRHYDLYANATFQTQVTELRWNDEAKRWTIFTDRDDRIQAHFVCMANGPLNRPKLPGISGVESFEGHSFHASRWDYDYTGGSPTGDLTQLADKRVGIIGTGATAVQCVPHVAAAAKQLYVFQRTPSSIDVRANRPTDPEFARSLEPGWQQRRMDNFNILVGGGFQEEDLVGDGWTEIYRNLAKMMKGDGGDAGLSREEIAAQAELEDFQKMEQIRARVGSIVEDPETAEALKPYYRQSCKRPCFDDHYLPTFNRQNVMLVDTQGQGVERITKNAVVAGGLEYEVDCLIFATGFEVGTSYWRRAGYDLTGRDGQLLSEKWSSGLSTFHGFLTHGFPNCFFMMGFQSGLTPNLLHAINEQSKHVAHILTQGLARGVETIECTEEAEADWVRMIHEGVQDRIQFQRDCTPGYLNNEGRPGEGDGWFGGAYSGGAEAFFELLREWRAAGDFEGLELSGPVAAR